MLALYLRDGVTPELWRPRRLRWSRWPTGVLAVLVALLLAAPGFGAETSAGGGADSNDPSAQEASPDNPLEDEFSSLDLFASITRLRPRIDIRQGFSIDQDFSRAKVDTFSTSVKARVVAPLSSVFAVRFTAQFAANQYDFSGDEAFLDTGRTSGDPFDELFSNEYRLEGRYQVYEDWAIVGGATFTSRWESGAAYRDGIQGGGFAGLGHIFFDRVSLIAGLSVGSKMGRSGVKLSPIVRVGIRVTDDIEIESENRGAKIGYRVNPSLNVFLRGGLKSDRYRLDGRPASIKDAEATAHSIQDRRAPIVAGASWKITKSWRLRGWAGAVVYQKYTVSDSDGKTIDRETSRAPAFTGQLELKYRF